MQHANNCNNCHHFHADPEQEGVFGECRKNAPVQMPQDVAGTQPGYSHKIYLGTWPAVFGDDLCSQHQESATVTANDTTESEVLRGSTKAACDERSTHAVNIDHIAESVCDAIDKHYDKNVEQLVDIHRQIDTLKAHIMDQGATQ